MAHTFIKPEKIVSQGLGMLRRELVLARIIKRLGAADFVGAEGDTVNIKIPAILTAREYAFRNDRSSPIVVDDLLEQTIPVVLDKQPYSAIAITDEQLTLDIDSWGEQVAAPQIRAVAEKLESYIAAAMAAGTYAETVTYDEGTDSFRDVAVDARRILNAANVPGDSRFAILGSNVEAAVLKEDVLTDVDVSGSDSALRDAVIGRIRGFTCIGNVNSIDPDAAYFGHSTAWAFANMAPELPTGATAGGGAVLDGLAMRWIRDYDAMYLRDRSVYSAFAGATSVEDGRDEDGTLTEENVRAVKVDFTGSGS